MISHQHHPYASQFHKSMHRKDATSVQNWLNYWIAHVNCWSLKSGYWTVFFDILIINAVQTYRKSLLLQESLETAAHSAVAWLQLHISIDWGRWTHSALPSDERQIAKKCKKYIKISDFKMLGFVRICMDLVQSCAICFVAAKLAPVEQLELLVPWGRKSLQASTTWTLCDGCVDFPRHERSSVRWDTGQMSSLSTTHSCI